MLEVLAQVSTALFGQLSQTAAYPTLLKNQGGYMVPVSWLGVAIAVLQAVKDTCEDKN